MGQHIPKPLGGIRIAGVYIRNNKTIGVIMKKAIIIIIVSLIISLIYIIIPAVPVKECNDERVILTDSSYDYAYNIYGHRIFKSKAKALKQFKKEYAVTLDFLKNEGFGEFNTSYDTLSKYARESWQYTVYEHVDNEELIKKQLFGVSSFLYTYFESDFRTYFPFNWTLS